MNIYKLTNPKSNYGAYKSCVVVANSEEEARLIHPDSNDTFCTFQWNKTNWEYKMNYETKYNRSNTWAAPNELTVRLIGVADSSITKPEVIEAYFLQ
jgi:hypothetical protein